MRIALTLIYEVDGEDPAAAEQKLLDATRDHRPVPGEGITLMETWASEPMLCVPLPGRGGGHE